MSEKWILDALLKTGGWDILHPESQPGWEQYGYDHNDVEKVFSRVKCGEMFPKAWSTVAEEVETKAINCEKMGLKGAACALYGRAVVLYGRAQYSYYADDPRKSVFHASLVRCFKKISELSPIQIERVELPFEGKKLYCNFYYSGNGEKKPCLILLPGMDMIKEDWHGAALRYAIPKGFAVIAIDQPGQGESLVNGLKVTLDNPEKAGKTIIDYLLTRKEVDGEKIVLLGASMGSYWGSRMAAYDKRIKGAATAMACYGSKYIIFNQAQPNFRINYKYMSGIYDDEEFDKMADQMVLDDVAPRIECPFLMIHGEYDELSTIESTFDVFKLVKAPKELWVYDNQFHPLGGVAAEYFTSALDWLANALDGKFKSGYSQEIFWKNNGDVVVGDARPTWWKYNEWK